MPELYLPGFLQFTSADFILLDKIEDAAAANNLGTIYSVKIISSKLMDAAPTNSQLAAKLFAGNAIRVLMRRVNYNH